MELCDQLERHWQGCMATLGGGARMTRFGGGAVVANPRVAGSAYNFTALAAVQPERLSTVLEIARVLLAAYRRPPALFLAPNAGDMAVLGAELVRLGWRRAMVQSVLTCRPPCPSAVAVGEAEGIQVERIGPDQVAEWGRILVEGYEVSPVAGQEIRNAWTALMQEPGAGARADFYLARIAGVAVGTGLTWSQGEITGLYAGAVRPAYRRRGIHRELVLRRLQDAADQGRRVAVLQTESGSPVEHLCMNHLGFEKAYDRELWLLPSHQR